MFQTPQFIKEANCDAYSKNDPWHGQQFPGFRAASEEGKISSMLSKLKYWVHGNSMQCADVLEGQIRDGAVPPVHENGCYSICPEGFHLVNARLARMVALGSMRITEFHMVRRDEGNDLGEELGKGLGEEPKFFWSHKLAGNPITNLDASGHLIRCTDDADFNYGFFWNYENCGYVCQRAPEKDWQLKPGAPRPGADDYSDEVLIAAGCFAASAWLVYDTYGRLKGQQPAAAAPTAPRQQLAAAAGTEPRRPEGDQKVLDKIRSAADDGMSKTGLKKFFRNSIDSREIDPALARLQEQGLIRTQDHSSGGTRFVAIEQVGGSSTATDAAVRRS